MNQSAILPVTAESLEACISSAQFWSGKIAIFGQRMRQKGERYKKVSVGLSSLTGLGVWGTLAASVAWPAIAVVSAASFGAAYLAGTSKRDEYERCAEAACSLGPRYSTALGELLDVRPLIGSADQNSVQIVRGAVARFQEVKKDKDFLKPFPAELQAERDAQKKAMLMTNVPKATSAVTG